MQRPVQRVLIVGGGIAGLTAALRLAEHGHGVTLVEREHVLGGNANTVCCKAIDGRCQLCGACLLADALEAARTHPALEVLTDTRLTGLSRANGSFSTSLSAPGGDRTASADAVLLASGFDHIPAGAKGPYGYGTLPAVTTGAEVERRLKTEGQAAYDDERLRRVAFIQCVGSRDEHVGRGYCSQVCCRYALRLARVFKARRPETEVTLFKMDIQHAGRDSAAAWRAAPGEGIRIVAGLPAVVRRAPEDPLQAEFLYDDILAARLGRETFDMVVLSTGMQPRQDAGSLAALADLNLDRFGFFATREDGVSTRAPGVFVAGACGAPRSIAESAAHAQIAAQACHRYLQEKGA